MSILNVLYTLTIGPLKLLFEAIFSCANTVLQNPGLSIICLSFALNIILLPLYNRADTIQAKENEIQKKLKPGVDHIKKSFKGDEQYMILQTYYRQNNYKPIYSLKGMISLVIEIPFFIAAASFLSNLQILNSTSFYFISDLGKPDGILYGFNLLPIVMTIINIINCIIYTEGQPLKSKIQLYLMALVFLVLLYNSPAGLSFYYLLNNVFSLIKNIFLKINIKKKVIGLLFIIWSIGLVFIVLTKFSFSSKILMFIMFISIIFFVFGIILFFNIKFIRLKLFEININNKSFLFASIFICLLIGLFIPTNVINSSPEEFINLANYVNPIQYIIYSFVLAFGTFVIWFNVYYSLMNERVKKVLSIMMCSLCFVLLVNYLFFGTNLGAMSNTLVYDDILNFSTLEVLINVTIDIAIILMVYIYKKKFKYFNNIILIVCLIFIIVSSVKIVNINCVSNDAYQRGYKNSLIVPEFSFSKKGKNVVVLMLDRAIGSYLPYFFEEKPELKEQFSGFTYYPNTISFGGHTNFSVPSLFGGYEYTPEELNKRDTELLKDKHDEALLVLPVLFSNNGYKTTVCDPPYAGYKEIPDLSIYDNYKNIKAYNTIDLFYENIDLYEILKRNLFCFSFTKCSPLLLQSILYNEGKYLKANTESSDNDYLFNKNYSVLQNMISMTKILNDESNNALIFQNSTTHENTNIQEGITNFGKTVGLQINNSLQFSYYYVDVISLQQIGKWFDYLKGNNVYDNTRIIICSDHSYSLGLYPEMVLGKNLDDDLMLYNPLLMVKDFNGQEYETNETLMTLADIPYLATKEIIIKPVNVFTNKQIEEVKKNDKVFYIINSNDYNIRKNNGNSFLPSKWYAVREDCRDIENWELIDDINIDIN